MKVLILGASGLLGSATFRILSEMRSWEVFGTIRSEEMKIFFSPSTSKKLIVLCDVSNQDEVDKIFEQLQPKVVINCISVAKSIIKLESVLEIVPILSLLPHRLARTCELTGARLIHISTDAIFSGSRGDYTEEDVPNVNDVYGASKLLGELSYPHTITLRTSIIGHELRGTNGLIDWFLTQQGSCKGFSRVIFSGLPAVVLAKVIRDIVIPKTNLFGIYHVAASPISKYELLRLVANVYGKSIELIASDHPVIDRSLNAQCFRNATGYSPPDWPQLVNIMHESR